MIVWIFLIVLSFVLGTYYGKQQYKAKLQAYLDSKFSQIVIGYENAGKQLLESNLEYEPLSMEEYHDLHKKDKEKKLLRAELLVMHTKYIETAHDLRNRFDEIDINEVEYYKRI
ncbi:MAG: hypothetical protein ACOCXP_03285 [Candidatus Dojkabacteria bacterium]